MKPTKTVRGAAVLCVWLAAAALGGCDRRDDAPAVLAPAEAAAARAAVDLAAADSKKAIAAAVHAAATAVNDTTITSTVRYQLSSGVELGLAELSVETRDGRVSLRGKAPDAASRDRATQRAAAVDGVVAVDNQLAVLN